MPALAGGDNGRAHRNHPWDVARTHGAGGNRAEEARQGPDRAKARAGPQEIGETFRLSPFWRIPKTGPVNVPVPVDRHVRLCDIPS